MWFLISITHFLQLAYWLKARIEYKVLDETLKEDFSRIQLLSKGDLTSIQRSADGRKWVLGFACDTRSYEYYYFDSITKRSEFLFCTRPALNDFILAPMKPISFRSRDGLEINGYLTCPRHKPAENLPLNT